MFLNDNLSLVEGLFLAQNPYQPFSLFFKVVYGQTAQKDRRSRELLDPDYAGVSSAINPLTMEVIEAAANKNLVVPGNGNLTHAQVEFLLLQSEDISTSPWAVVGSPVITTNTFKATAQFNNVIQPVATVEGTLYTLSFIASVESGGNTANYGYRHLSSATGNVTALTLTETPAPYEITVLGKIGGGNVNFGLRDDNTSDWAEVTISKFSVVEGPSVYPLYAKTEALAVVLIERSGLPSFDLTEMPKTVDALDGRADGVDIKTTNWNPRAGWSFDGYTATADGTQVTVVVQCTTPVDDPSAYFEVSWTLLDYTQGNCGMKVSNNSDTDAAIERPEGNYTIRKYGGTVASVQPLVSLDFIGSIRINHVKQISTAQATTLIQFRPGIDADDVPNGTGINIFTSANDQYSNLFLYRDGGGSKQLRIKDGTNTAIVYGDWLASKAYEARITTGLVGSDPKMQLSYREIDEYTLAPTTAWLAISAVTDFVGYFPLADEMLLRQAKSAGYNVGLLGIRSKSAITWETPT